MEPSQSQVLRCRAQLADLVGEGEAEVLMHHVEVVHLTAGDALLRHEVANEHLFLLCEGELTLSHGTGAARIALGAIEPGAWLGELGFIDRGTSPVSVAASEACVLVRLGHGQLLGLLEQDPGLAVVVLRQVTAGLAERLRRTNVLIGEHLDVASFHGSRPPRWVSNALGWLQRGGAGDQ